ncbi:MAG: TIR domain-containing protein [Sphingomonadaceae bacterium]|nr:MAG: TIR domain-containing protein [Sphingomonadaceae bacterium]
MADIFLSYARADQSRVTKLAAALEGAGYSIWWDKHLKGGHQFSEDIEAAIARAKAVLVVWSKDAVKSEWVRDEAAYGRDHNKLVPVRIDDTLPPMGYRQRHAINLDDPDAMAALTEALDRHVGGKHQAPELDTPKTRSPKAALLALPLIAAIGGLGLWMFQGGADTHNPSAATFTSERDVGLAILPFASNQSRNADDGQMLAANLTDRLNSFQRLRLISAASLPAQAPQGNAIAQMASELGVAYVIDGTIAHNGPNVRVAVRLLDSADGRQLWSEQYDGKADHLDIVEARIAHAVAAVLQVRLDIGQGNLSLSSGVEPAAHREFLARVEAMTRLANENDRLAAYGHFKRATELDPDFADALAALSYVMVWFGPDRLNMDMEDYLERLGRHAYRAVEINPKSKLARAAKAQYVMRVEGDIPGAIAIVKPLVAEAPDFAPARIIYGLTAQSDHRFRDSYDQFDAVMALNPFDRTVNALRTLSATEMGDVDAGQKHFEECEIDCRERARTWLESLLLFAGKNEIERAFAQYAESVPQRIFEQASKSGDELDWNTLVEQEVTIPRQYVDAVFYGKAIDADILPPGWHAMHIAAKSGDDDLALTLAARLMNRTTAWNIIDVIGYGNYQFQRQLRADARYHSLFDGEGEQAILAHRRNIGLEFGLPVEPRHARAKLAHQPIRAD